MKKLLHNLTHLIRIKKLFIPLVILTVALLVAGVVYADVLDRTPPRGTVPNPGTQQQELANITFPAPYNVFEFVVTCAGCHGGGIDQNAGHFGNWAGSSMGSAARDPVFRANQIAVNNIIQGLTGEDGAGNMCMRCHSPNGWMSGRFDPTLAGDAEGRTMIHSILASTDDEGILCEFCHRAIGNVTFKRADLNPNDPVWNMMAGISDWPHTGNPYVDQAGDPTIAVGNPYGDTTLQINDGMAYVGKYSGSVDIYTSDMPLSDTLFTGQTYGIYPPYWWTNPGGTVINPDGSVPIHFEAPIGPPISPITGTYDYQAQGLSLEHPTLGDRPGLFPQPVPDDNTFLRSSEFCGSCHDLVVPILNHGMPEQRTYTEWKFSDFGTSNTRCQDCHMPTQMHEYADDTPVSLNPDPVLAGWFPYGKDRNPQGGTAFHKFAGANRDLPMMMKELYPEVDLEVLGAPTGNDPRIFPGMLSDRSTMWDRAQRNSEISLQDAVDLEITQVPTWNSEGNFCDVKVKVTNTAGHRIPSGYPDGRRFWIELQVSDGSGIVYQSGYYDQTQANLMTAPGVDFNRALEPLIDATGDNPNAVMVYERVTGTCKENGTVKCEASPSLLNDKILFDNRILPAGFDYVALRQAGVKFWNYGADMVPYEDTDRYPAGQNWDEVTYRFDEGLDQTSCAGLTARAEVYWQTHTREFMEHLRDQDTSTVRPEGPPSIYEINYPLTPNYLSDIIGLDTIDDPYSNKALNDNWGGIAYSAWLLSGQSTPYLVAVADTAVDLPAQPTGLTGFGTSPYTLSLSWNSVTGADGYLLWVRYGANDATAAWDKLAILDGAATTFIHDAVNVGKTFGYKVQAFNGAGIGPESEVINAATATDVPLPPENLTAFWSGLNAVALSWFDTADNEIDFVVQRQDVPVTAGFYDIAFVQSQTPGGATGGNSFIDDCSVQDGVTWAQNPCIPPQSGSTYNYQVAARNASGMSIWSLPVQALTAGPPGAPTNLLASTGDNITVNLTWNASTGVVEGYRVERSTDGVIFAAIGTVGPTVTTYTDADPTLMQGLTYYYRVFAFNAAFGDSLPSNVAPVTLGVPGPASPTNLLGAWAYDPAGIDGVVVNLTWTDIATDETGYYIERAQAPDLIWSLLATTGSFNGTAQYIDSTVTQKNTYYYRVQAFRNDPPIVVSAYSNEITVIIPGEIPQAPEGLQVSKVQKYSIKIVWLDTSVNEAGFEVERSTDGMNWTLVATLPIDSTSYVDTGLTRNTTYWYRVRAFNSVGNSAWTAEVSGTTK